MVAVLSEQIAKAFEEKTKIKTIALPAYEKLDTPVSSHADMLMCVIEKNIFLYKDYYYQNSELFTDLKTKYNIVLTEKECKKYYPNDIGLNVLVIGRKIFCNQKNTANEIINFANENGYKIINVKQGYSSCSTLVVDENNAITGDIGMYKALENEGIKTVLILPNKIKLSGYNHGFIGGSGAVFENTLYSFGEIDKNEGFSEILTLIKEKKYNFIPILSGGVCDFGGIKFFK